MDVNGDGFLDAVTNDFTWPPAPAPVRIFTNDTRGGFLESTRSVLGTDVNMIHPRHYAIADFTGDGRQDLVIADHGEDLPPFPGGQTRIFVRTDSGIRDETAIRLPQVKAFTHNVSAGDIDGDGDIDLYMCNIWGADRVGPRFYVNDGQGVFTPDPSRLPPSIADLTHKYESSLLLDVDLDGDLDLVLGAQERQGMVRDALLLNDGTGRFTAGPEEAFPPRILNEQGGTVAVASADIDRNGWPDLILSTHRNYLEPRIQLLLNAGGGHFINGTDGIPQSWRIREPDHTWLKWVLPADINADGWVDLVVSGSGANSPPPTLYVNLGGRFRDISEILPTVSGWPFLTVVPGDLDRDDDTDLFLIGAGNSNYHVLRNQRPYDAGIAVRILAVRKVGTGGGLVEDGHGRLSCGLRCNAAYSYGETVQLHATAAEDSEFIAWDGDEGCAQGAVAMVRDRTCVARFERR